jgi:hypothetical protein
VFTVSKNPIDFPLVVSEALGQLNLIPQVESWPVSERLTAFFFILLDTLDGMKELRATSESGGDSSSPGAEPLDFADVFRQEASGVTSAFHQELREALSGVTRAADVPAINRLVTDTAPARFLVAELLIQLISASLNDQTADRQRSAALADKTLAYAASVLSTPVPQKAVDVVRYSVEAGYLPLDKIPVIRDWFKTEEEQDSDSATSKETDSRDPSGEAGV